MAESSVATRRSGILGDKRSLRRREAIAGYIAVSPWILGFLIFSAGPIIASFVLMFTKWEVITPAEFIGFRNFERLIGDDLVLKSLGNTFFYTFLAVPLSMIASLAHCFSTRCEQASETRR